MSENQDKKSTQNTRKVLGIGKSAINAAKLEAKINESIRGYSPTSVVSRMQNEPASSYRAHSTVSRASAVVITKTKTGALSSHVGSTSAHMALTEKEKDRRLYALQMAELHRSSTKISDKNIKASEQSAGVFQEANELSHSLPKEISQEEPNLHYARDIASLPNNKKVNKVVAELSELTPKIQPASADQSGITINDEAQNSKRHRKVDTIQKSKKVALNIYDSAKLETSHPKEIKRNKNKPSIKQGRFFGEYENHNIPLDREDDFSASRNTRSRFHTFRHHSSKKQRNDAFRQVKKLCKEVIIPDYITVCELASRMSEKAAKVVEMLLNLGVQATINQTLDSELAELITSEFGHKVKRVTTEDIINDILTKDILAKKQQELVQHRAPVVVVMGHVDHGKTSLLDALRSTDVVAKESGGITQHIGAYKVALPSNKCITFLDTPGHEAFTAMRMRGAQVTDIVVLIIAADDGVKAQTIEAINHAKAASVPIIVAINKIDKSNSDVAAIKNALLSNNLVPEEFGGDVMVIEISAKTGKGLDKLEESILMHAELLNLQANYAGGATGRVLESRLDKGKGAVVTFLVQSGSLKSGDLVVAGTASGRIRSLIDDKGLVITEAVPSTPVEIFGLDHLPVVGDKFVVLNEERAAKELINIRNAQEKERKLSINCPIKMGDKIFDKIKIKGKELPLVIKTDVLGSVEAILQIISKYSSKEVSLKVIHSGVGSINESDVTLALASSALVLGFNVRANTNAKAMIKNGRIDVRYYSVIYDLAEDVKTALTGLLSPISKEKFLGYAEVRKIFNLSGIGKVCGCFVTEGFVKRAANARLLRDGIVLHEGKLKSLRRQKEDVKEAREGFECGLTFEKYTDIKEGDIVEVYEVVEEKRTQL